MLISLYNLQLAYRYFNMQRLLDYIDHDADAVVLVEFDEGAFEAFEGAADDPDAVADFHIRGVGD